MTTKLKKTVTVHEAARMCGYKSTAGFLMKVAVTHGLVLHRNGDGRRAPCYAVVDDVRKFIKNYGVAQVRKPAAKTVKKPARKPEKAA